VQPISTAQITSNHRNNIKSMLVAQHYLVSLVSLLHPQLKQCWDFNHKSMVILMIQDCTVIFLRYHFCTISSCWNNGEISTKNLW